MEDYTKEAIVTFQNMSALAYKYARNARDRAEGNDLSTDYANGWQKLAAQESLAARQLMGIE